MDGRASRLNSLRESIAQLEGEKFQMEVEVEEIRSKLQLDPSIIVNRHIRLLHEYNEVKDTAQGLLGLIADARGVRQAEVEREFGVKEGD
ncbi:hypothetical protein N7448_005609 [Penicillium atrosanguineum]|uniref:Swi5-domain-containing protein n=1 Tax=Penicillium atrosanguineum TaxID=1132637 RepID=A0A9W9U0B2_9EURO|nr:Protein kinase [Penicillium atrosanguineum]KAJ5126297.1 hypothetical protein N7526_008474 [Penicillium atrosanguineum]KAJ5137055.1 hypothetical protein N7448_005609 [Penicillium atrosanguineum]KAJ5293387.1 Protein kinase [Penicillium atrosanguineum]KAJ5302578.1 hypothetical protein N7476_009377 [Penicillium atrosanguineum]